MNFFTKQYSCSAAYASTVATVNGELYPSYINNY